MYEDILNAMIEASLHAEKVIKEIYSKPFDVEIKGDDSPVTAADKLADALIREEIRAKFPSFAFLTEESKDTRERLEKDYVIIVDPVDGTKEFVNHHDDFTTNIACAYKGEVVVGLINVPMKDVMYYAIKGQGSYRKKKGESPVRIHVSDRVAENLRVVKSRSFFNDKEAALIEKYRGHFESVKEMGAATKFCAIAEGTADVMYRIGGNTKEWDVASGDLIVTEAGGIMVKPTDLLPYKYNREDVYNREGYILVNKKENILL